MINLKENTKVGPDEQSNTIGAEVLDYEIRPGTYFYIETDLDGNEIEGTA